MTNSSLDKEAAISGENLAELTKVFKSIVEIKDRSYGFPAKKYDQCFVGSEAVGRLIEKQIASDAADAERIGNLLLNAGIFHHVQRAHSFKSEYLFYRFSEDEDHGRVEQKVDGSSVSWTDFIPLAMSRQHDLSLQANIPEVDENLASLYQVELESCGVEPLDKHNVKLLDNVHPKTWVDPEPKENYNLVVLGAGAGGLISAAAAAGVGGKVALVESHLLGGDCLNIGCVPSKALIKSAKVASLVRNAEKYGVTFDGEAKVDFAKVMERLRKLRADISPVDSASRYADQLGVDVFIGRGKFIGKNTLEVNGKRLHFSKAVVATGGTAAVPNIEGIQSVPYLTNNTVFNLTELPKRLAVIGAGPIGLELAQSFQRLGSQVTVFTRSGEIMPKEDRQAAEIIKKSMEDDGVEFRNNVEFIKVENGATDSVTMIVKQHGQEIRPEFDKLLIAIGRKPAVNNMGFEEAGIKFDERLGVEIDDHLQTSNPNVYAVGDIATKYQFTHVANFMARIAIRNALFYGRDKFSNLLIPWATFTDPEVAHVGLYEKDLQDRDIDYSTFMKEFDDVDRAILESETKGFVKVHVKKGTDEILGATIVGSHAGDMISEITVAMQANKGLGGLASVIHPYPTMAEAIGQTGDAYNKTRLTPTIKNIFYQLMALQRK